MAERHVEARAGRGDLHIRRDHCLTTADRGTHRLAKHWMDAGTAALHLAVDADDCTLAVGDGAPSSSLTSSGMRRSPSIALASKSRRRSSTKRPAKGLRITAMPTARTTGRVAVTPRSERTHLAYRDELSDLDHRILLMWPTALTLSSRRDCLAFVAAGGEVFAQAVAQTGETGGEIAAVDRDFGATDEARFIRGQE